MATVQLPATGIAQRRPAGILAYGAGQAMKLALPPDARGRSSSRATRKDATTRFRSRCPSHAG